MDLPVKTFLDLIRDMSSAVTASAANLIDMSVGSVCRALIDANAAMGLWIQWLILLTLQTTRAATSTGSDLDSWMNDFSFSRLPALQSSGVVTFSRFVGGAPVSIPIGMMVKTGDGMVVFNVVGDPANPAFHAESSNYIMPSGVLSLDLPVIAGIAGTAGNVLQNTITLLASPISGIDTITNLLPTYGGSDPEADSAFRTRFSGYIASLSAATATAIGFAITQVNPNLRYLIKENSGLTGAYQPGNMVILVDNGTGSLSNELFNLISSNISAVRGLGTSFSIASPTVVPAQITISISVPSGILKADLYNPISLALQQYISALSIGGLLSLTRLSQIIYTTAPTITNISQVLINNSNTDMQIDQGSVAVFSSLTID